MNKPAMILAKDYEMELDCHKTWLNNNVLVVGSSGSGKTRTIVEPNLRNAYGSYLISDPKGSLYQKYGDYFRLLNYEVVVLDFIHPGFCNHYNPLAFVHTERDILILSHMLVGQVESSRVDPFWDRASGVLVSALIAYLMQFKDKREQTIKELLKLVTQCYRSDLGYSEMDLIMNRVKDKAPESFAATQYEKIRSCPTKTLNSILMTVESKLGMLDCDSINDMLSDNDISFAAMGRKKTAVFVIISDTDRSLDKLANLFFTQAIHELTHYADQFCDGHALPIPVQFIMDDFATNVTIDNFPTAISSIRSRNISVILMVQAESQLESRYGVDAKTIIGNCDTYVYMGGNDLGTARVVAERGDVPLLKILSMPVHNCWIFQRGAMPKFCEKYLEIEEQEKCNDRVCG